MGGCTTQPRRQEQKATIIRSNCRPGRGCDGINWEIQDCPTVAATGIATDKDPRFLREGLPTTTTTSSRKTREPAGRCCNPANGDDGWTGRDFGIAREYQKKSKQTAEEELLCSAVEWTNSSSSSSSRRRQRAADIRSAADLEVRQGLGAGVARKSPETNSPLTLSCSTA
ncbi:predicted protein [Histoplasma capsulatum var. duboisii H88]|uniref:Predicted protein n=1 Tax=Ajellomyces capsulatus (strain H88) TaxID=544711 RepID=F0UHS6_AJEC8|nr:predicted protein [Histoplasma capsulatum var. duboisii H88]